MATLFLTKTTRSDLSNTDINIGQVIECVDTNEFFYDTARSVRIQTNYIKTVETDDDRLAIIEPSEDYVYLVNKTSGFYIYVADVGWKPITKTSEINPYISAYTEMYPHTLEQNGIKVAPRTLARAVFTNDGDSIETLLGNITSVGLAKGSVEATSSNQKWFSIPVPFNDYITGGNHIIVFHKGLLVPFNDYAIDEATSRLYYDAGLDLGDSFDFLFIYHSKIPTKSNTYIDGGYISNGTIATNKLAKVSSSYNLSDPTTLATSQAVSNLNTFLTNRLDSIAPNSVKNVTASGNAYEIYLSMPGYTLNDGNTLIVRTTVALAYGCKVKINTFDQVPIYVDDQPIQNNMVGAGQAINLRYNADDNRFYLTNGEMYKLKTITTSYTSTGGEINIPIGVDNFIKDTDKLEVFQDNIPLFEGINYTIVNSNITLLGYTTDADSTFVFRVSKIVKNYT